MCVFLHGSEASYFSYAHEIQQGHSKISVNGEMKNKQNSKIAKSNGNGSSGGKNGHKPITKAPFLRVKSFTKLVLRNASS